MCLSLMRDPGHWIWINCYLKIVCHQELLPTMQQTSLVVNAVGRILKVTNQNWPSSCWLCSAHWRNRFLFRATYLESQQWRIIFGATFRESILHIYTLLQAVYVTKAYWNVGNLISGSSAFGDPQNKVCHCFHCFPIYLPWNDGTTCHDLRFLNVEF